MTLVAIVVLFAIGTSILSWDNARTRDLAPRFHWPDETSNAFFAGRVARGESLAVPEPRNVEVGNLIHPRTVNVRADGAIVPGAYLGLPLWYGLIGRVIGERAMLFVTPLLAAFGLLAFASIVRRLWSPTIAVVATVLLALHPSVWFFTATAFLPNVPFVALVLVGVAVLIHRSSSRGDAEGSHAMVPRYDAVRFFALLSMTPTVGRWLIGSLLLGLALTIRTHELLWVLAMIGVLAWRQRIRWQSLLVLGIGIALPFVPILMLNAQLYGSPLTTGYALLQDGGAAPTEFAPSLLPGWLTALIAPFGWHPIEAFVRFWKYTVVPYPWFIAFAVVGFVAHVLSHFRTKVRKVGGAGGRGALLRTMLLMLWLILYYGSWTIADPLVRETNVLTISYVRYWLPIVVVLAPWVAAGLLAIVHRIPMRWRAHTMVLLLVGIALTSLAQVVKDPTEGLLRQRQAIDEHRSRARAVRQATEPDAVIVSHRMDKVFFPERAVVHVPVEVFSPPLTEGEREGVVKALRALVDRAPVYWYAAGVVAVPGLTFIDTGRTPFGERLWRVE